MNNIRRNPGKEELKEHQNSDSCSAVVSSISGGVGTSIIGYSKTPHYTYDWIEYEELDHYICTKCREEITVEEYEALSN